VVALAAHTIIRLLAVADLVVVLAQGPTLVVVLALVDKVITADLAAHINKVLAVAAVLARLVNRLVVRFLVVVVLAILHIQLGQLQHHLVLVVDMLVAVVGVDGMELAELPLMAAAMVEAETKQVLQGQ
jgi:hypothetical protein